MFMILDVCRIGGSPVPVELTRITSIVITAIQIAVPIMLIIWGMLDFGKAVAAGKDDDIKEAQSLFTKRLIAAIVVFLIVAIVRFVITLFVGAESGEAISCIEAFINGPQ